MKTPIQPLAAGLLLLAFLPRSSFAQWYFDDAAAYDYYGSATAIGDFDGDGVGDLAVGIPGEDLGSASAAGAVRVHYSLPVVGPGAKSEQYINEQRLGFTPRTLERFGYSLAVGNFDGDAYDDLAIGAPGEDVGFRDAAGAVYVVYGGPGGLDLTRRQLWHQDVPSVAGMCEDVDWFGFCVATGDFDADGNSDLAVGVPYEDIGSIVRAGAVNVIYGANQLGLQAPRNRVWYQGNSGVNDTAEAYDLYGYSLATGDFDANGVTDLAVGAPNEDLTSYDGTSSAVNAGMVNILRGLAFQGIQTSNDFSWHPEWLSYDIGFTSGANFGYSLAGGSLQDGNGDFLAIGAPGHRVGASNLPGGMVQVTQRRFEGSLIVWRRQRWHQDSPGIAGGVESGDQFGLSLAAGAVDNTGIDALAIGVPGESLGSLGGAGVVQVLYRDQVTKQLGSNGSAMWHQNSPGVPDVARAGDAFGTSLTMGDLTGEGFEDLAIGVPYDRVGNHNAAGAVNVLRGGGQEGFEGITALGAQWLHEFFWTFGGGGGGF